MSEKFAAFCARLLRHSASKVWHESARFRITRKNVVPLGLFGTCVLAGLVHAGNSPLSLPSSFVDSLARYTGQTAEPLVKAFEKGKEVVDHIDAVADALRTNWEAIAPLLSRLSDTAKIDMSLPSLYHKFAVDVPQRMSELRDIESLLKDPPGTWLNVTVREDFMNDERACRFALAAYGPIILGPMGLIPLHRMPNPTDFSIDAYRHCIREYAGIAEKDVVFKSREMPLAADRGAPLLKPRISSSSRLDAADILCPTFYVAVDHDAKRIVVAIRGTLSVADVMTDCVAEAAGFGAAGRGAVAHAGMAAAAERVRERAAGAVAAAAAGSGYSALVVTGHSLGGAVAHLLAISLAHRPWFPSTPDRPAASLPPSIRSIQAVAFGPPPYLSLQQVASPAGFLGLPAMQLPSLRLPLPFGPSPLLITLPAIPLPGPLFKLAPPSLRRPTLSLRSFVNDLDIVPRLSLHGAEVAAAFIAGDDDKTPLDPELFLPGEVVVVRHQGPVGMQFSSRNGTDELLSTRALLAMLMGLHKSKPMTDHLPDKYDRVLKELRKER